MYYESQKEDLVGDELLSRKEAAAYIGSSPGTLGFWACRGGPHLPFIKIGRLAKYRKRDLDAFLASRPVNDLDGDKLLSRKDAAAYIGSSPGTLGLWACRGVPHLPFIKVGRRAKYRRQDLDAYLASRPVKVSADRRRRDGREAALAPQDLAQVPAGSFEEVST
jgi:hypothetical protein